ncbi:hypothetical protein DFH29DRAFT_1005747 [Suillus ampliporus]|nr:hypothetical protein DFH29DRAFT_1005747 [Suillus ampliporus]
MSATLLSAMGLIGIPYHFGQIHIQTDIHLLSAIGLKLGVPDMLMEYQDPDDDCIPLWATEISILQTKKLAIRSLSGFMTNHKDLLTILLIDVEELKKHAGPQSRSEVVEVLEECPSLSKFSQWLSHMTTNTEDPTIMKMFCHVWQHPITVMITTWLHHPNGSFNIDEKDPDLCATVVQLIPSFSPSSDQLQDLFPECGGLEDVDCCREHSYTGLIFIYFPMYHTSIRLSSVPSKSHPTLIQPIRCPSAFRMTCGYLRISSYSSRIHRIHPVHIHSTSLVHSYAHSLVTN